MTSRYPQAVGWSAMMHLLIVAVIVFATWFAQRHLRDTAMAFELVAGEGDNIDANEAPALGTTLKAPEPTVPAPRAEVPPSPPIATAPTPIQPTPTPRAATPAPAPTKPAV